MKLFDHVAIAGPSDATAPLVMQSILQQFGIRAHLYRFHQKRNVEDFFAGKGVPRECGSTLLLGHAGGPDDDPRIVFDVVDQRDGDPDAVEGWEPYDFVLSKDTVPNLVTAPRGTLVVTGCGAGREPLARAFLEAGYEGYVGATEEYVDSDSALLFAIGLFYHLGAENRDYCEKTHTTAGAVRLAAAMDPDCEVGTRAYRYWDPRDFGLDATSPDARTGERSISSGPAHAGGE